MASRSYFEFLSFSCAIYRRQAGLTSWSPPFNYSVRRSVIIIGAMSDWMTGFSQMRSYRWFRARLCWIYHYSLAMNSSDLDFDRPNVSDGIDSILTVARPGLLKHLPVAPCSYLAYSQCSTSAINWGVAFDRARSPPNRHSVMRSKCDRPCPADSLCSLHLSFGAKLQAGWCWSFGLKLPRLRSRSMSFPQFHLKRLQHQLWPNFITAEMIIL